MQGAASGELPMYSEEGLYNRDLFLADSSDVLVYFEDENWEEFYLTLLERASIKANIETVFCLGGKGQLKRKMREDPLPGKKRVFVFDKDFDDLLGCVVRSAETVYLGRYSIENYFFDAGLVTRFAVAQVKGLRRAEVGRLISDEQIASFVAWYEEVVRYYVVAQKFRLGIETTKVPLTDLATFPDGARRQEWWDDYLARFHERIRLVRPHLAEDVFLEAELRDALRPVPSCASVADLSDFCHFPGKHLIEFLVNLIARILPHSDHEDVRYRYMMASVLHLQQADLVDISDRINAVIAA